MARRPSDPKSSEITPESLYLRRREFIKNGALFLATAAGVGGALVALSSNKRPEPKSATPAAEQPPTATASSPVTKPAPELIFRPNQYRVNEKLTPFEDVTTYNNFYEFGTGKSDPAENAGTLRTKPWIVAIEGEVAKPGTYDIDRLRNSFALEERIYRMRCVEAWSMVIPWLGFPLASLLKRAEPTSRAKYVAFTTLLDPEQMPGQKRDILDWPYVEGLRIDEAMHPLTLLAVGLYGKPLRNQNGAPIRLVVPWKYGFKGIKSIVNIRLTETQPETTWNKAAPAEYGFYANVNPLVDHPRWSQATERRVGEFRRRPTLMFNGYADEVAHLYAGMDLRTNF